MINPFADVNWHPDRAGLRGFARSLMIGFPIVAVVWAVFHRVSTGDWNLMSAVWLAAAGAGAGLLFHLLPAAARPFYVVWYGVACSIGLVVSNTLLAAAFYLLLTPIGVVRRLAGWRAIERGPDPAATTYWRPAPPPADAARYLRQF
jgi:hypothetical protein